MALLRINDKRRSQEEKIEILLQAATGNYCALLGKVIIIAPREQKLTDITCDLGPVARSLVSANRWLRGIKLYRFPCYLALVSTNHASSNPGQAYFSLERAEMYAWYNFLDESSACSPVQLIQLCLPRRIRRGVMFRLCLQLLLLRLQIFFQKVFKGTAERMHPKNGLSKRRHYSCNFHRNLAIPEHYRKNVSYHFHRLGNVCDMVSPLECIRKDSEATSCESKKNRTEL